MKPKLLLAAPLLIAALAGCISDDAEIDQGPDARDGAGFTFGDPIVTVAEPAGAENFIAVSDDGQTIITCTHNTYVKSQAAVISVDGGATWTFHAPLPEPYPGGDCEVAIDKSDNTLYLFASNTGMSMSVAWTKDGGASWQTSLLTSQPTNSPTVVLANDRQWALARNGTVYQWHMTPYLLMNEIGFTVSRDGGASWELTRSITDTQPGVTNAHGRPSFGSDGRIIVPILRSDFPNNMENFPATLILIESFDDGETWTERDVMHVTDAIRFQTACTGVAPNGDGTDTIYWTYMIDNADRSHIQQWLIISPDSGDTWSDPILLRDGDGSQSHCWADGAPDGTGTIIFEAASGEGYGAAAGPHVVMAKVQPDGSAEWVVVSGALTHTNEFVSVEHTADGRAVGTFTDATHPTLPAPFEDQSGFQYVVIQE